MAPVYNGDDSFSINHFTYLLMKADLFHYLKRSGIFKDNGRYEYGGVTRILASEKTELKRAEKNRLNGTPYSKNEWNNIQLKLAKRNKANLHKHSLKSIVDINN
jgi:hypothetical protein